MRRTGRRRRSSGAWGFGRRRTLSNTYGSRAVGGANSCSHSCGASGRKQTREALSCDGYCPLSSPCNLTINCGAMKVWTRLILGTFLLLTTHRARAEDHFLTIGGGSSADNNQVSLEKNILFFQKVLAESGKGKAPHDIYFSDGDDPGKDLQYIDPDFEPPTLNALLARLNGNEHELYMQYRSHELPGVRGASTRPALTKWFDDVGAKLNDGDRLFIYFTGHGGRGRPPRNTTLALWNDSSMPVREFVTLLDRVPAGVQVVIVMVQCHAGGFADVLFDRGTPPRLSNANRCGFFATLHNRQAAGCTADIDEENYHEYSTFFFAALHGRSRTGEAVARPDYDRDGKVSFAEAHAYVQIESDTIDVPLATSDVFLRQFSEASVTNPKGLVTSDDPFERILELATPARRAVLVALSEQLQLDGDGRVSDAREMSDKIAKE